MVTRLWLFVVFVLSPVICLAQGFPELPALTGQELWPLSYVMPPAILPVFTGPKQISDYVNSKPTSLVAGTSGTLVAPREYFLCTSTCTITPPVPAAGYEFCVMNDDNVSTVITLAALGSGAKYESTARTGYGTAGTGTFVSAGAAADKVCLLGRDSTHYLTVSFNGSWVAN
jgi:hypothetical protein